MEQSRTHSLHEGKIVSNIIFYGERFATKERRTIPYAAPRMFELEMTIYNSTIIISELKNCSLYNCLIVGSSVDDSELSNCTVLQEVQFSEIREQSILRNCKARDCVISESMVSRGSEVIGGRLSSCEIKDSTLNSTYDHNSSISICQINNTKLHSSKLYSSQISPETQQTSCKPLSTFRRFPPEIRTMTFAHAIKLTSELPPLITAFRGDQVLYHEALEYIHKTQGFTVNDVRRLNDTQLGCMQKLVITAGNKVPWVPERLRLHAKNIRELDIRFINSKEAPKRLRSVVKFWTRQLDGIESISTTFPTKKRRECKTLMRFSEKLKRCFEETQELYQTSRVWGFR